MDFILHSHVKYNISQQKEFLKGQVLNVLFSYLKIFKDEKVLSKESTEDFQKFMSFYSQDDIKELLEEESAKELVVGTKDYFTHVSAMLLMGVLEMIHCCSIFYKDESFSQEEEFRLTVFSHDNNDNYECRISNGTFIPYIEMDFKNEAVSGVTIGPKNNMDINMEGLRKFLSSKEIQISDSQIKKSRIPYRF